MKVEAGAMIGAYQIEARIGSGASGEVWRGRREGHVVAIKFMTDQPDPSGKYRRSLQAEVEALSVLRHPNIPRLYDADLEAERPYVVMQYVEGESLDRLIGSGGIFSVPLKQRVDALAQIGSALMAVHRQGIIHRDIKPGNIRGVTRPFLLDFSVAIRRAEVTAETQHIGTSLYMPPLGEALDEHSDYFAFGLVVYEVLFGRHALHGGDKMPATLDETRRLTTLQLRQGNWFRPTQLEALEMPGDLQGVNRGRLEALLARALGPRESRWPDPASFIQAVRETVLADENLPYVETVRAPIFNPLPSPAARPDTADGVAENVETAHPEQPARAQVFSRWVMVAVLVFSLVWLFIMSRYPL